jgi:UDP-N-acetylmuramyl tripeptide synthase
VEPRAFEYLLDGRQVLAVSGTNGKTTTTHLLAAAVREDRGDKEVVTNTDGANLHYGIASALCKDLSAPVAVLETDERVVSDMIKFGKPAVLVFLNFSRDQLDRHHEIKSLAKSWRTALEQAGAEGPVVVGNAADPLVVWAAELAHSTVWVDTATKWNEDSALCPNCGAMLVTDTQAVPGLRSGAAEPVQPNTTPATAGSTAWRCPNCGLHKPETEYGVVGNEIRLPDGQLVDPKLQVPGYFNLSNAACALAAAATYGVDVPVAIRGMRKVTAPAGRFATAKIGSSQARLILAKNPAGWAEALPIAQSEPVVLAIDSVAADGKDVSWLWDVPYERLAGRHVICTGPRAQDLAVRLSYAGVEHEIIPDLLTAVDWCSRAKPTWENVPAPRPCEGQIIDVIATYTPFQKLLKLGGLR